MTGLVANNASLQQEHEKADLYLRYHKDIFWPEGMEDRVRVGFLPQAFTPLSVGGSYLKRARGRKLPTTLYMPAEYEVVEVTTVRDTGAIFRVMVRARMGKRADLVMVMDGDYEVVTAFWLRDRGKIRVEDWGVYEVPIRTEVEEERRQLRESLDEMRRQSRSDDIT